MNGTIFHTQKFLGYHPKNKFSWNHLLFFENDDLIAVLPGALVGTTYESPIGASYGSLVVQDMPFNKYIDLVDVFSDFCRQQSYERALLTPAPIIYQSVLQQNLDYALAYRGYTFDKHYISHVIEVLPHDPIPHFQSTTRRYIHKYLREHHIEVQISRDIESFYPILVENKARHGVTPTHSLEDLKILRKLFPEEIVLFMVYHRGNPIAGSLNFVCNQQVLLVFYNMLDYRYEKFHPIHVVMYEVYRWAQMKGFKWIDIGVSQDTKAEDHMTPAYSLIKFKEKFNAKGVMRSTYYKRFL